MSNRGAEHKESFGTHTEGDDRHDEREEGSEGTKDAEDEVGAEREEERDERDTGGDRGQDEGVRQVAEDGLGRNVLLARELRDKVAGVSQLCARARGRGAPSPVTERDVLTLDLSLEVTDRIPDGRRDLLTTRTRHDERELATQKHDRDSRMPR